MYKKDILNNIKFVALVANNLIKNPWLLNYELPPVNIAGKLSTIFSQQGKEDGKYYVRPTIMEDSDNPGNLKHYEDGWERARDKGWGIEFLTEKEAEDFSKWLSNFHRLTLKNKNLTI
tara:strand:- start:751 stop:1104 length:354 start_codon:yes stop_codon:yes gene_type:complete